MRLAVALLQALQGDMRVDLSGGKRGVTEHVLDASQIRPVVEQVRREAVPQFVRGHLPVNPTIEKVFFHQLFYRHRGQAALARFVEKNGAGIGGRLTFVTMDKRAKLWHPVSCHAVFGLSLLGPLSKDFRIWCKQSQMSA